MPTARRQLAYFLLACALLGPVALWGLDKPLALWLHQHGAGLRPFFGALTAGADTARAALFFSFSVGGIPGGFVVLLGVFLLGRYGLKAPGAGVFLLVALVALNSEVAASLLKILCQRPRPDVFLAHGMAGAGFGQAPTRDFGFPSSHAAVYFGLFWPVAWQLPRYRWPLLVLPGLLAVGRLVLEEHFLGDVLASVVLVGGFTWLFSALPWITPRGPFRLRRVWALRSSAREREE